MINLSVLRPFTSCVLVALIALPSLLPAQTHVVDPADLHKETIAATSARQRNVETITDLLSSTPATQKALAAARIDPTQVKTAVSSLDDQELARLAARAQTAQADFAAGRLTDRDLLLLLLGFAALILIIVAVR